MTFTRSLLGLLAVLLLSLPAQAQRGQPDFGEAQIEVAYDDGTSGPATVTLKADTEIEARQILLSLTDGDKDHELRLRDSGDGTFSARADLPAMRDVRSLRLGTGEGSGRAFQMPELREGRNGFTGMREANGWRVTVVITTSGGTTITITVSG